MGRVFGGGAFKPGPEHGVAPPAAQGTGVSGGVEAEPEKRILAEEPPVSEEDDSVLESLTALTPEELDKQDLTLVPMSALFREVSLEAALNIYHQRELIRRLDNLRDQLESLGNHLERQGQSTGDYLQTIMGDLKKK